MKIARVVALLGLLMVPVSAWAADRKGSNGPRNLRVTGTTAYTVSLAWDAVKGTGVTYRVVRKYWGDEESAGSQTSYTWRSNLGSDEGYVFYVYAVDAAGNRSGETNTVVATTKRDTSAPAKPILEVTNVGPTYASLVWSAADDDPNLSWWLYRDGVAILENKKQTSANVALLKTETTYSFTVRARDDGVNYSPISDPKTATTTASNPNDVTPPSVPTNLWADHWGDCEVELDWDDSTDDFDPQWVIAYEIYINGRFDHATSQLHTRAVAYGDLHGVNTFAVIAVDSAGNKADAAEAEANLVGCFPP